MEYCPGGSLDHPTSAALDESQLLARFWEALAGLEYLHSRSPAILHRDLKPGNMLVGADDRLKISDFGLSRSLDTERVTTSGSNWVSPGFSPPEQWENFGDVDERGDLFSLGATFFYLLTRRLYSPHESFDGIHVKAVEILFRRLLAAQRKDRMPSVAEVRRCWKVLTEEVTPSDYLRLSREERLAKLAAVSDVYLGMPQGDLGPCLDAASFLEEVVLVESDPEVRARAEAYLVHVKGELASIAQEMEQENPSY
jgi:serine/threonine protein kinase